MTDYTDMASVENYVGVDPIYQNHANDTEAPMKGSGPEDKLLESLDEGATEVPAKEDSDEPSLEDRVKALEDFCREWNVPIGAAALQFPLAHPAETRHLRR